jgi:hypothetical protein
MQNVFCASMSFNETIGLLLKIGVPSLKTTGTTTKCSLYKTKIREMLRFKGQI